MTGKYFFLLWEIKRHLYKLHKNLKVCKISLRNGKKFGKIEKISCKKFENLRINISTIIKIKKYLPNYYENLVYKKSRRTTTKNLKLTWRVRPATFAKKLGIHPWDVQGCLPISFFWKDSQGIYHPGRRRHAGFV